MVDGVQVSDPWSLVAVAIVTVALPALATWLKSKTNQQDSMRKSWEKAQESLGKQSKSEVANLHAAIAEVNQRAERAEKKADSSNLFIQEKLMQSNEEIRTALDRANDCIGHNTEVLGEVKDTLRELAGSRR